MKSVLIPATVQRTQIAHHEIIEAFVLASQVTQEILMESDVHQSLLQSMTDVKKIKIVQVKKLA